jgi:hypothetical protein
MMALLTPLEMLKLKEKLKTLQKQQRGQPVQQSK